jgi:ferredoxin/flavodoxin---NADP+ reductase
MTSRRNVEILREYAQREPTPGRKRVVLRFLLSPSELIAGEDGALAAVELVRNELVADESGTLRARATEETETIAAGLVFRAIGYRGIPLPGVPFDERRGVIPNEGGRIVHADSGERLAGEYVVGWIKRGPSGVIGTNKKDAQETVDAILADLGAGAETSAGDGDGPSAGADAGPSSNGASGGLHPSTPDAGALERLLRERQPDVVTYEGWEAIDRHEQARGEQSGRPRVKLTRIEEMLRVAASEEP